MKRGREVSVRELGPELQQKARAIGAGIRLGPDSVLHALTGTANGKGKGGKRRGRDLEHPQQAALFAWAARLAPRYPQLDLLYAVPNYAGNVSRVVRARAKREGKKPGVPDVVLPVRTREYGALYLEMKSEEGKPTPAQREWMRKLRDAGNSVHLANSARVAGLIVLEYLGLPLDLVRELDVVMAVSP